MTLWCRSFTAGSLRCGVALLCGVAGGLIVPWSALAAPVLWSDPITTTAPGVYGVSGREAIYADNKRRTGLFYTERVFNPDGKVEYQAETEATTLVPPALAADGSGYVLLGHGTARTIEAISASGQVRWSYAVPTGDGVTAMVAGDDGAAYVAVATATDVEVLRLSPTAGSVTSATPIPEADFGLYQMFAEPSGVAVITATHVLFLSQEGQITADVGPIPSGFAGYPWAPGSTTVTSNDAGDVFVASAPGTDGNTTNGIAVTKVEPTGQVAWTAYTPASGATGGTTTIAALPDGGVAYDVSSQSIGVLNADGTSRWNSESAVGYEGPLLADSSGHLDLASPIVGGACSDKVDTCTGFRVEQLLATTGQVQRTVAVIPTKDPGIDWLCGGFALGPGLFYVLDDPTTPPSSICQNGATHPQLQAHALPETDGPYPTPPATTEPGPVPPPAYVALGDSFSSGEGNPPYEPGTEILGFNVCHRSEAAYPRLLNNDLHLGPMTFAACSGAVTDNLFNPNSTNHEPAQFNALDKNTQVVTLTVGGDDAGFVEVLKHCVEGLRLTDSGWPYWQGAECSTSDQLRELIAARLAVLEGTASPFSVESNPPIHPLSEVLERIHSDAPAARIVIGGYPQLFGSKATTYELHPTLAHPRERACPVWPGAGVPADFVLYMDARWLNEQGERLNSIIQKAAVDAEAVGIPVRFAPPSAFKGHALCDESESWIHPVELSSSSNVEPGSFHPTENGQSKGYEPAFAAALKHLQG